MALKVGLQMDPIESVDINADSTFRIAFEAQQRGHRLVHYLPESLSFDCGRVSALGREVELRQDCGRHFEAGSERVWNLADLDVVWLRQDPAFRHVLRNNHSFAGYGQGWHTCGE